MTAKNVSADELSLIPTSVASGDKTSNRGLQIGDCAEVVGQIAKYYASNIGLVTALGRSQVPNMKDFYVKLADGIHGRFFEFQLRVPPPTMAGLLLDTWRSPLSCSTRGRAEGRHLRFVTRDFDIHLKITRTDDRTTVLGQVTPVPRAGLVSLLIGQQQKGTTATDPGGEFKLLEVPSATRGGSASAKVAVEILVPGQRIICEFPAV